MYSSAFTIILFIHSSKYASCAIGFHRKTVVNFICVVSLQLEIHLFSTRLVIEHSGVVGLSMMLMYNVLR